MPAARMSLLVARSLFVATALANLLVPQTTEAYFYSPAVFSASFETGASGWSGFVNASGSGFSWIRQSGQTPSPGTGPDNDFTYKNSNGHYLYMDGSAVPQGASATVSTPVITVPSAFEDDCYISFYYSMNGIGVGQLSIYSVDVGSTVPAPAAWTRSGDQCTSAGWKFGQAKLNNGPGNQFQVYFNGTALEDGSFVRGDIGIDNVIINCGAGCRATNNRSFSSFSDFSYGLDGYTNSAADDFDWLRHNSTVPSTQTGPLYDHTTLDPGCSYLGSLGGFYIYMETSFPVSIGQQAILLSPPFTAPTTPSTCFVSFWYSMYGATIGSLNVTTDLTSQPDAKWCRNGQQTSTGTNWRRGLFWVQAPGSTFQIIFTGTAGSSFTGDIGLDDIDISCCAESCVHFNRLTFECDNEGLMDTGANGFAYQTSVADHTTQTNNGARIFANFNQVGTIAKNLTALNTMGMNCTVSFYFWIDMPSDNAAVANVTTGGFTSGQGFWGLRNATTRAREWTLQSGTFHLPAPDTSFRVTWRTNWDSHPWRAIYMDDIDFVCCPEGLSAAQTFAPTTSTVETNAQTTGSCIGPCTPANTMPTTAPHTFAPTTRPPANTRSTTAPQTFAPTTSAPANTMPTTAPQTFAPTTSTPANTRPTTAQQTFAPTTSTPANTRPTTAPQTFAPTTSTPANTRPTTAQQTFAPTTRPPETNAQTTGSCIGPCTPANTRPTTTSRATTSTRETGSFATIGDRPSVPEESSTSPGILVGSIAGGFVVLAIVILLVALLVRNRRWTPPTSSGGGDKRTVMVDNPAFENSIPSSPLPRNNGRVNQPSQRYGSRHAQSLQQPATARTRNWTMPPSAPPAQSSNIDLTSNAAYGSQRPSLHLPHQVAQTSTVGMTSNTAYGVPAQGRAAPRPSLRQQQNGSEHTQHRGTVQETDGQEYYTMMNQQPAAAYNGNWSMRPTAPGAKPSNIDLTTNTSYATRRPSLHLPHQAAEPSTVGMTSNTAYGVPAQVRAAPSTSLPQQQNGSGHSQHRGTVQETDGQEYYSMIDEQPDRQRRPSLHLPHQAAEPSNVGMTSNTAYGVPAQGRAAPSTSLPQQQNGSERTQHRGTVQQTNGQEYDSRISQQPGQQRRPSLPFPRQVAEPSTVGMTTNTGYGVQAQGRAAPRTSLQHQQNGSEHTQHRGTVQQTNGQEYYSQQPDQQRRPPLNLPHQVAEPSAVGMTTNTGYGVQAQVRAAPRTSLRQQQNGSEHTQHPGTVQPTNGQEYYSQIDQQPDQQRRPSLNLPHHVAQTSTVGMTSNTAYGVQAQGRAAPSTSLQHQQNGSERTQHRGTVQPLQAAAYNGNWTMTPSPPPAQPSNIDLTTNTAYSIQRPSQLSPHRAAETSAVGMTTNTAYGALPSRTVPTTEAFSKDPTFPEGGQEKERYEVPDPPSETVLTTEAVSTDPTFPQGDKKKHDYEVPDPPSETVLTTEAVSTDPMFSQGDKKKHDYEVPDPPSETVLTTEVVSTDPTFPQGDKKKHDYEVPDPPIETVLTTEAVSTGPMFPQGDKKKHDYEVPDPPSETVLTTEAVSTDPTFPQGDKKKHDYEVPDPTDPTEDGPYLDIIP